MAKVQVEQLKVEGMMCEMCRSSVTKSINSIDGVVSAEVNLLNETAQIEYLPDKCSVDELIAAVGKAGYKAEIKAEFSAQKAAQRTAKEQNYRMIRIIAGLIGSAIVMYIMYFSGLNHESSALVQLVITAPILILIAFPIFISAFRSLRNKILSMEFMYALGIGTAFSASAFATFDIIFSHEFVFFETGLMLTSFLMLGKYLETKAKGETSSAIKKLMNLSPQTATVIRNEIEYEISAKEIVVGEMIIIKPGAKIPVDGVVISGTSFVDEAMLTGEPMPKSKKTDDPVYAGTINGDGAFNMMAQKIGDNTFVNKIIKLVENAQSSKPKSIEFADKIIKIFIPSVLSISLVVLFVWLLAGYDIYFALKSAIAVIVIACPCALGMASPTAISVGLGRAAQLGVLFKNTDVFDKFSSIDTVVFDKTGTITKGCPTVGEYGVINITEIEFWQYLLSLEKLSSHPLAKAIVNYCETKGIRANEVLNFNNSSGSGVSGRVGGKLIKIGKFNFVSNPGAETQNINGTIVHISVDEIYAGYVVLIDEIQKSAHITIAQLKSMGIQTVMLSGDSEQNANSVGDKIGIDQVFGNLLPNDKYNKLRELQNSGRKLIFVGDGINDAPALAQADIGIAIGSGTDIAIESGDCVLVRGDLYSVIDAISLGKRVMQAIKLNLFWALFYNVALIPLAAGVFYPLWGFHLSPEIAGLAMAFSSVTVISLSLLLKRYKP